LITIAFAFLGVRVPRVDPGRVHGSRPEERRDSADIG
jgi:hypothetical protein